MPAPDPILDAIRRFVADTFCDGRVQGLHSDTGLVTSGIVDSAGVLVLVDFLERRFAIAIEDPDVGLDNFNSLAALAALVRARQGRQGRDRRRAHA